jgi:hypothetical protein
MQLRLISGFYLLGRLAISRIERSSGFRVLASIEMGKFAVMG